MVQRDELAEIEGHKLIERKGITYRRKMLFFTTGEPFTGTGIWRWEDGSKMEETPYVDGKEHGMVFGYNRDGSKSRETPYVDGKSHGTAIFYWKNGSKKVETPWVNSKKHGTMIEYYEDGSKVREVVYENGKTIYSRAF